MGTPLKSGAVPATVSSENNFCHTATVSKGAGRRQKIEQARRPASAKLTSTQRHSILREESLKNEKNTLLLFIFPVIGC